MKYHLSCSKGPSLIFQKKNFNVNQESPVPLALYTSAKTIMFSRFQVPEQFKMFLKTKIFTLDWDLNPGSLLFHATIVEPIEVL